MHKTAIFGKCVMFYMTFHAESKTGAPAVKIQCLCGPLPPHGSHHITASVGCTSSTATTRVCLATGASELVDISLLFNCLIEPFRRDNWRNI